MSKKSISFLFIFLLLVFLLFRSCQSKKTGEVVLPSIDKNQMSIAFEKFQVIGEGRNFLTVMINLPQTLPPGYQIYALILDEQEHPLIKVSGYTYDPQLEGRNHIWFYFFLYAPGNYIHVLPLDSVLGKHASKYIKFMVAKGNNVVMEKVVKYHEFWGDEKSSLIADLPSPPDQIPGYLVLSDYTFLAKGDFRKPGGYYVEGKIEGSNGQWTHFVTLSEIQGEKHVPEYIISADQGWLELRTGKTHSMKEAISPRPPYVEGWWDGKGYFHPRPVKVHGLKLK